MGIIVSIYKKNFLKRFDKEEGIPYYSASDFPGLACEEGTFRNRSGIEIRFYIYSYSGYDGSRLILFCPGMGPGHTAYLSEIETLAKAGLRVLTLDYTGCGSSGGERMPSVNAPTRDALELLDHLKPREEIIPIGHSLGGYTALNLAHLRDDVTRAVILSGFVGIADEMRGFVKFPFLANRVSRYEKKIDPYFASLDNRSWLAATKDRLLWFHSQDDPMVNYDNNAGVVKGIGNPNVRLVTVDGRKHNPQYTDAAVAAMNEWIGGFNRLIGEGKLATPEEKKTYFADKPIGRMTEQDPAVYDEILRFVRA